MYASPAREAEIDPPSVSSYIRGSLSFDLANHHKFIETIIFPVGHNNNKRLFQVLCLAALVAVVVSHGHKPAYSSQHISKHDGKPEVVEIGHGHDGHGHIVDYYVSTLKINLTID